MRSQPGTGPAAGRGSGPDTGPDTAGVESGRRPRTRLGIGLGTAAAVVGIAVGVSPGGADARPQPTPPAGVTHPDPHVLNFARGLRAEPKKLPSRRSSAPVAVNVDGCDHRYGTPKQCVPWHFPPATKDRCGWLFAHGFTTLKVRGADRLRLDNNGDGIACGRGDADGAGQQR